ncbi:histidine kinase [Caldicoprobacter algeriensis]|uniref:sensor histidine kinase n=1 Tax=Caldicoprobacter algeriensis TaxID=699281 RepID=UPI002079C7F0|nr:histidine kinase [Caldicoprobacter algeriensis]
MISKIILLFKKIIMGLESVSVLKFNSLKQRLIFLLGISTIISLVFSAIVSYNSIISIQQNKINTAISSTLERLTDQLDRDYYSIMQITQQMMPQGHIGSDVDEYFFTTQPYNRSVLTRRISKNIELITYPYPNVVLAMYYNPRYDAVLFYNLPPIEKFSLEDLPKLKQHLEITYHTFHPSIYRFGDQQVISVTRTALFSNDVSMVIYVEARSDIEKSLDALFNAQRMRYIFLQIDENKEIKYSSSPDIFSVGQRFDLGSQELTGRINGYIWNQRKSQHGFTNIILVPVSSYNCELYAWSTTMLIITFVILLIVALIGIMLYQLIYKPLHLFEREMEEVGKGNMAMINYHIGIEEFDRMFDRFNTMKMQIQDLMRDIEKKEKQRHALEVEKLYYQINPHFLMNALNSVHWMAVINKQHDISNYISKLNYILSYSLGKTDQDTTLRTEIKMLQTYLDLQKMRYDFEAFVNVVEGDYLDTHVPRLILQPLAENAICHGLDQNGILTIDVSPDYQSNMIKVVIQDNGKGLDPQILESISYPGHLNNGAFGQGIGLRYVYFMLESFYGDRASMIVESKPHEGTTVKLFLPFC